jgi:hypothetical protein
MSTCDKCGGIVPLHNDAVFVEALTKDTPELLLIAKSRHFLSVVKNGVTLCEGSPSRAQYIAGQPRDRRGYRYDTNLEAKIRIAYAQAKDHAAQLIEQE